MVLPLILGAAAAGAALFGAKEGVGAISKTSQSKKIQQSAQRIHSQACHNLEEARTTTGAILETLGKQKLNVWDKRLGRFVQLYEQLQNVELTGQAEVGEFQVAQLTREALGEMKQLSWQAHEVALGGATALGTGALAGVASYGGAMMFASASTGTAIGSLSGVAATNATLAWFGGGSLASGGLGMAGGMMVLGGLVTGPIVAVGGLMFHGKARKNLAQAAADAAKVVEAVEAMESGISLLETIATAAQAFQNLIIRLGSLLDSILDDLAAVIQSAGTNYQTYSSEQRHQVYLAVQCTQVLKLVLETPLLTPEGNLQASCYQALEQAETFVGQLAEIPSSPRVVAHG